MPLALQPCSTFWAPHTQTCSCRAPVAVPGLEKRGWGRLEGRPPPQPRRAISQAAFEVSTLQRPLVKHQRQTGVGGARSFKSANKSQIWTKRRGRRWGGQNEWQEKRKRTEMWGRMEGGNRGVPSWGDVKGAASDFPAAAEPLRAPPVPLSSFSFNYTSCFPSLFPTFLLFSTLAFLILTLFFFVVPLISL